MSSVFAYEIGQDSISVEYDSGARYLYTFASAGRNNIETMKALALRGEGLRSFIRKQVEGKHARVED